MLNKMDFWSGMSNGQPLFRSLVYPRWLTRILTHQLEIHDFDDCIEKAQIMVIRL